jgi:hypothetical protein
MCVDLPVPYVVFSPPVFVSELKGCFLGGRGRTSPNPIVHQSAMCSVSTLHPTLVAPSTASAGDPTKVPLGSLPPMVMNQEKPTQ